MESASLKWYERTHGNGKKTKNIYGQVQGQDIYLAGQHFAISMRGRSVGGTDGPHFEFVLTNEKLGIEILIAGKPSLGPFCANVRFTLHGRFFLQHGARFGYELVKRVIEELGGRITRSEVSRVDIAIDLPGVDIDEFVRPYKVGHFITKSRSTPTYISDCRTLYFGRAGSLIRCCIYDKLCEARSKGTLEQMRHRRWGGNIPDSSTRVEFRLRRQALNEMNRGGRYPRASRPSGQSNKQQARGNPALLRFQVNHRSHIYIS